jgi:hypothetical protein
MSKEREPLGIGDSIGLVTLVVVLLGMALTLPVWFKALLLPAIVGGIFLFIRKSVWTANWKRLHQTLATLMLTALVGFVGVSQLTAEWRNEHSEIVLYYLGKELDGQTVVLTKQIVPASVVQPRMFVDPNYTANFEITGIAMRKNYEPSANVQWVCLDFPTKITIPSVGSSYLWQPGNDEGTQFCYFFNGLERVTPELMISTPPFYGTPVPSEGMKVTMRVYYDRLAQATFTIRAPD